MVLFIPPPETVTVTTPLYVPSGVTVKFVEARLTTPLEGPLNPTVVATTGVVTSIVTDEFWLMEPRLVTLYV